MTINIPANISLDDLYKLYYYSSLIDEKMGKDIMAGVIIPKKGKSEYEDN